MWSYFLHQRSISLSISHSSTKKPGQKPCTKYLSMVRGVFVRGFLSGRFCRRWVLSIPLLSEYLHYNRKLTITFNFTFHMYDKIFLKCDVTYSFTHLPLSQTFTLSRTPSSVTYFMDAPQRTRVMTGKWQVRRK